MAEPPGSSEATEPRQTPRPATPRWVKLTGALALVLVLVVAVLLLLGGGDHGPGRHSGGGADAGESARPEGSGLGTHRGPAGAHP